MTWADKNSTWYFILSFRYDFLVYFSQLHSDRAKGGPTWPNLGNLTKNREQNTNLCKKYHASSHFSKNTTRPRGTGVVFITTWSSNSVKITREKIPRRGIFWPYLVKKIPRGKIPRRGPRSTASYDARTTATSPFTARRTASQKKTRTASS